MPDAYAPHVQQHAVAPTHDYVGVAGDEMAEDDVVADLEQAAVGDVQARRPVHAAADAASP